MNIFIFFFEVINEIMKKYKIWSIILLVIYSGSIATALRASSLILQARTSTSTSTTTESPEIVSDEIEENETTEILNNTSTKPTLTGIPQIDYKWDPNLPRELNGYNLSDYPFFNSVPPEEEIDFKCDDTLHDGFYASVKHKCQLYHHCLSGIRYDFLCANFTAFDQKTFICHFVSEIDCKNSHKYFHRNDALYMATTTTAAPTTTVSTTTTTTTPAPPPPRRGHRPRRPYRRRKPQYDDYYDEYEDDDYYEERSFRRRRKQRPRQRRPEYIDDDDDYDDRRKMTDERYESKSHRNRYEYDDDSFTEEKRKVGGKSRNRKGSNSRNNDNPRTEHQDRKPTGYNPQQKDNDEGDRSESGDSRQPVHKHRNDRNEQPTVLVKPSVSSTSSLGSLFDKPRAAPRIARPVPNYEKSKYSYNNTKVSSTTTEAPENYEEYYDEDEDIPANPTHSKPLQSESKNKNRAEEKEIEQDETYKPSAEVEEEEPQNVRLVKRPFLPSRGGSPYLPRGLQPVGQHNKHSGTESTPIDMGSTISGVRLLEHGAPILRSNSKGSSRNSAIGSRTPYSAQSLRQPIENIYESEYDVTLNDALNPTLKPLHSDLPRRSSFSQSRDLDSQTIFSDYKNDRYSRVSRDYY